MVRKLFLLLPVMAGMALWSCTSPADVPASRIVIEEPASLQFEPAEITAQTEWHGKPLDYSFTVTIRNTSATQSVDITSLDFSQGDQGFVAPTSILPLHLEPLEVATIPLHLFTQAEGVYIDTLIVNNNEAVFCPLQVTVMPEVAYTVFVTEINFGVIDLGQSKEFTAAVHNQGDAEATLTAINIIGPGAALFTVLPVTMPLTIAPGEFFAFTVRCTPMQTGDFAATLKADIQYSGSGSVIDTVPLYGTAE